MACMFQKIEIAEEETFFFHLPSCQWFENFPCQFCLCWWPVPQKPGKLREAPSSQMMDRCALQALRTRTIPTIGLDDLKCLFKPKWFHDNSSSIFLSSGMSSKSSICSLPTKSRQVLRLSGVPHLHKLHRHLSRCAWRHQPCITAAPNDFSEQSEIQLVNSHLLPSSPLTLKSFEKNPTS